MSKKKFFAVTVGWEPGIYNDYYENIKPMVSGAKGSSNTHKGFNTYSEAEKWLKDLGRPDLCVIRSLKEDKKSSGSSELIADDNSLPWENIQDVVPRSDILRQESFERRKFSGDDLKSRTHGIDYEVLDNNPDTEHNHERNRINTPDRSPITHKVRDFASKYGFEHLSDEQLRAVQRVNGKGLLFAVPGSGKTTVIVARTGYLIFAENISPDKIMTLTFTKAAADEMKSRYIKSFAHRIEKDIPQFRTIHSFCYSIILPKLKKCGCSIPAHTIDSVVTFLSEDNQDTGKKITLQKILYDILKKNGVNNHADAADERIQQRLLTYISSCKNKKLSDEQKNCSVYLSKEICIPFKPLFDAYVKELKRYDCMDYDDMLQLSYDGLRENEHVLKKLREDYKYWSVDEAQDNSLLQYDLMSLLAGDNGNLFMVGDDDQSIYGFRGAEPKALLSFGRKPDVVTMVMGTNYRSDSLIVDSTRMFIEIANDRADKKMIPNVQQKGTIRIWPSVPSLMEQYSFILKAVEENAIENRNVPKEDWKSLAVLYRNNISGLAVMFLLQKYGIPFTASKSAGELLRGKPIRLIINIIHFALHPASYKQYEKVKHSIDVYVENDNKTEFQRLCKQNPNTPILDLIMMLRHDQEHLEKIRIAQDIIKRIRLLTSAEAVKVIINSSMKIGQTSGMGDRERIFALLTLGALYPDLNDFIRAISEMFRKFHQEDSTVEDEKEELAERIDTGEYGQNEISTKVILSTAHKAKGQEFDHVIIIDALEPPVFPTPGNELERSDPEEERRLFYVAMTRAKHKLDILSVESYYGTNETPSSFISDYANICEALTDQKIIQTEWPNLPKLTEEDLRIPGLKERTLYAVRKGFKTGIFYTDAERRSAVNGFSNPEQKTCHSMYEALQYLYPEGVPKERLPLNTDTLSGILSSSLQINKKIDLPEWLNTALPRLAAVSRISQLSPHDVVKIKESADELFRDESETDYSGKGITYALTYLPVNVLKIWKPLWVMVEKHMLPFQINVLETGVGPGTATIGLLSFYATLARDNPNIQFNITYNSVERQTDFLPIYLAMTQACLQSMPENLHVNIMPTEVCNAYDYMRSISDSAYDIILESNMMNASEGLSGDKMKAWLRGIEVGLKPNGFVIQIEPGTERDRKNLERLATALRPIAQSCDQGKNSVYIAGFTLQKDAVDIRLRSGKETHWFNWLLVKRDNS